MIAKSNWLECPHKDCLYRAPKRYKGSLYSYNCEYLIITGKSRIKQHPPTSKTRQTASYIKKNRKKVRR